MKVRTTAPSESDKNYISVYNGGYNKALRIKSNGSCLPNCVGYVWGQWRELLGASPKLTTGNAKTFYGYTSDGYSRGKTPRIGAIICWNGTYGHVAIVVEIKNENLRNENMHCIIIDLGRLILKFIFILLSESK